MTTNEAPSTTPVEHSDNDKPAPRASPPEKIVPVAFFREHPGLLLTASYLLLIIVGLIYEVWLFQRFRVNVLYYAEATDFLLVPFREPLVMLVTIAPIPLYILFVRVANWIGTRLPLVGSRYRAMLARSRGWQGMAGSVLAVFLWAIAFSANYAKYVERSIREGRRKDLTVEVTSGARIVGPLIGTTNQFVFIFDRAARQTHIVQAENVARIIVASPPLKKR